METVEVDYRAMGESVSLEKRFMRALAAGEEQEALALLEKLGQYASADMLAIAKSSTFELVAATILRTIIRLAAQDSGLPTPVVDAITESYAQELARMGRTPDSHDTRRLTAAMIHELCGEINKQKAARYSPPVYKAIQYVQMNLGQDLSLAAVARQVGASPGHLSKAFTAQTGEGISRYIRRMRCRRAAELLREPEGTVQDIGGIVGYPDANYFVKVFKMEYGVTPSAYRKSAQ